MSFDTAAGAVLSMSAVLPATYDASGYGALTKVPIGEITNIGEFGKEFALVTHQPLATRGVKKATQTERRCGSDRSRGCWGCEGGKSSGCVCLGLCVLAGR